MNNSKILKPKISIVMSVYNESKYLRESIESILNQTFEDFELIIVNDCSTDNSMEIIKSYNDKRINIINNRKNIGVFNSRNNVLKIARGKYIALLDGDDVACVNRIGMQFDYLENNLHIFLVGSSAIYIDEKGNEIGKFRKYNDYEMLAWRLPKSCSIVSSSVMFRNEGFFYNSNCGGAGDYKLYLQILSQGKHLTNLPDFLVKYRLHKGSMSISNKGEQESFRDKIIKENKFRGKFRLRFIPKLGWHYIKTYMEKRGK